MLRHFWSILLLVPVALLADSPVAIAPDALIDVWGRQYLTEQHIEIRFLSAHRFTAVVNNYFVRTG